MGPHEVPRNIWGKSIGRTYGSAEMCGRGSNTIGEVKVLDSTADSVADSARDSDARIGPRIVVRIGGVKVDFDSCVILISESAVIGSRIGRRIERFDFP
jgi:hypothetical protein